MCCDLSTSRFETFISDFFEPKSHAVISSSLFSIADPESYVIEGKKFARFRLCAFVGVMYGHYCTPTLISQRQPQALKYSFIVPCEKKATSYRYSPCTLR